MGGVHPARSRPVLAGVGLTLCLAACAEPKTPTLQTFGMTPNARTALEEALRAHRRLFDAQPATLTIRMYADPQDPDLTYEAFDHEAGEIRMHWPEDDEPYGEWTLVHELAHAFQYALDPEAYVREPSWVHEGLAEYAVWEFYRGRDEAEAEAFLRDQARRYLRRSRPFDEVLADVYRASWRRSYPACHLAVHVLGSEVALDYFRSHGVGQPEEELRRTTGADAAQLAARVDRLARELSERAGRE